jgi:hypothetical protein
MVPALSCPELSGKTKGLQWCLGNGPAGTKEGLGKLGARPERQRSHVRIVSGAPGKHVPEVPGLWRLDLP